MKPYWGFPDILMRYLCANVHVVFISRRHNAQLVRCLCYRKYSTGGSEQDSYSKCASSHYGQTDILFGAWATCFK